MQFHAERPALEATKYNTYKFYICSDASLSMSGFRPVTASVISAAKLSSVSRERCLLFISFMAENDCSHLYVEPNRQTYLCANERKCGNFSAGSMRQNWIISCEFGEVGISMNLLLKTELHLTSMTSCCRFGSRAQILSSGNTNGFVNRMTLSCSASNSLNLARKASRRHFSLSLYCTRGSEHSAERY